MLTKSIISFILLLMFFHIPAYALPADLPSGLLIADDTGIHIKKDGLYFMDLNNVYPGYTIKKALIIKNTDKKNSFSLYMQSQPLKTKGPVDLLDKIKLELKLEGKIIYSGRIYGDDTINIVVNPLVLGKFRQGESKVLDIKITLGRNISNDMFYDKSIAYIRWHFTAMQEQTFPPPITGESLDVLLLLEIVLISIILINVQKRHKRKTV